MWAECTVTLYTKLSSVTCVGSEYFSSTEPRGRFTLGTHATFPFCPVNERDCYIRISKPAAGFARSAFISACHATILIFVL